jgi:hypothetical protein
MHAVMLKKPTARLLLASIVALTAPSAALNAAGKGAGASFAARVLSAQNVERRAAGLTEFRWDPQLAANAARYAASLAATNRWQHSEAHERIGQGENLWMGTRSAYQPEEMVNDWLVEKRVFRAGRFPNVSKTGKMADVGHYTQLIWPATHRVGCAVDSSTNWDYLVCRYAEPGNVEGEAVGQPQLASR